jgi:hypothetical protein
VHEFVPGPVLLQVAVGAHPPLLKRHEFMAAQAVPVPEYPVLHAHVLVPGPVDVQTACTSHPPPLTLQLSIALQTFPLPA